MVYRSSASGTSSGGCSARNFGGWARSTAIASATGGGPPHSRVRGWSFVRIADFPVTSGFGTRRAGVGSSSCYWSARARAPHSANAASAVRSATRVNTGPRRLRGSSVGPRLGVADVARYCSCATRRRTRGTRSSRGLCSSVRRRTTVRTFLCGGPRGAVRPSSWPVLRAGRPRGLAVVDGHVLRRGATRTVAPQAAAGAVAGAADPVA